MKIEDDKRRRLVYECSFEVKAGAQKSPFAMALYVKHAHVHSMDGVEVEGGQVPEVRLAKCLLSHLSSSRLQRQHAAQTTVETGAVEDYDHRKSNCIMRLTIIAPENVHEVEVDSAMEVQDVQGLAEAEVSHTLQLRTAA